MPATPIANPTKFINKGTTKVVYCATISDYTSPTRSEINAGTDLTRAITDFEGWLTTSEQVDAPNLDARFTPKIAGNITAEDSSLTFNADVAGDDVRALLPRDTAGYIIWLDGGDVAGRKMDVYPIVASSVGKVRNAQGEEPAKLTIQFAITDVPADDVEIPA